MKSNGVTRLVFVFNRFVIKVPNFTNKWFHFLMGLTSNINENQTWKYNSGKYESGKSHLLCPVIWCSWGGWILIMKRARLISESYWHTLSMEKDFKEHLEFFPGDDTMSNYGILDDRQIVKIDYGQLDNSWGEDFKPRKQ